MWGETTTATTASIMFRLGYLLRTQGFQHKFFHCFLSSWLHSFLLLLCKPILVAKQACFSNFAELQSTNTFGAISSITISCMKCFHKIIDVWHSRFQPFGLCLPLQTKTDVVSLGRLVEVAMVTETSLQKEVMMIIEVRCEKPERVAHESYWTSLLTLPSSEALWGWWAADKYILTSSGLQPSSPRQK